VNHRALQVINIHDAPQHKWAVLATRYRILPYIFGSVLIIIILARTIELSSRSGRPFIEIGLFSDKLCYLGSYEMIICPNYLPPYETFLTIIAIMLVVTLWITRKK
jgi:hypothetical protein